MNKVDRSQARPDNSSPKSSQQSISNVRTYSFVTSLSIGRPGTGIRCPKRSLHVHHTLRNNSLSSNRALSSRSVVSPRLRSSTAICHSANSAGKYTSTTEYRSSLPTTRQLSSATKTGSDQHGKTLNWRAKYTMLPSDTTPRHNPRPGSNATAVT